MGIGPYPDVAGGFVRDAVLSKREQEVLAELVRKHDAEPRPAQAPVQP